MKRNGRIFLLILSLAFGICGCTVPQYIWPQEDIRAYEVNQNTLAWKVLIASRTSVFKDAIVHEIVNAFRDRAVT